MDDQFPPPMHVLTRKQDHKPIPKRESIDDERTRLGDRNRLVVPAIYPIQVTKRGRALAFEPGVEKWRECLPIPLIRSLGEVAYGEVRRRQGGHPAPVTVPQEALLRRSPNSWQSGRLFPGSNRGSSDTSEGRLLA